MLDDWRVDTPVAEGSRHTPWHAWHFNLRDFPGRPIVQAKSSFESEPFILKQWVTAILNYYSEKLFGVTIITC